METYEELEKIKEEIFKKIAEYYEVKKGEKGESVPSSYRISYAKAIFDEKEVISITDSILKEWLGLGPKAREFTKMFSEYLGVSKTVLVNSGSSANLLALTALKSNKIKKPLNNGEEVITPAVTFPTVVNPIIQNDLIPVIVDANIETYNIDIERLKEAITPKTRAIMLPHMLGNSNDMDAIIDIAEDHKLYLIEDNCDALGSEFDGKKTGSFGILSTCSFYPAHHITMGEGGSISIIADDANLYRVIISLRDWGRDCWCESDEKSPTGACDRRFEWEIGGTKYDHRYIYSHIGYNLKPIEIQAAMGVEQLKKIGDFNQKRRDNFQYLYNNLRKYVEYISFIKKPKKANPAWFAFPIMVNEKAPFSRYEITKYLEDKGIQTRLLFAGEITKQPAYKSIQFKSSGSLENSEKVMKNSFFIGIHPGLNELQLKYIVKIFDSFMEGFR
ncbi:lipopolysaccharide biosynthesis protein RfbH [Halobacteriota archaeon]